MSNINFETYFQNGGNQYYDSKIIISILEDILGKPIDEIKKEVNDSQIIVTKEQIEEFLEQKFIEENPELKKKIESPRPKKNSNIVLGFSMQDIEDLSQGFSDYLEARGYCFEPYTLEYFNKYTTIVRNKANLLLKIIEKISTKDITSVQDILSDLDIILDKNGNILKSDIVRLVTPIIYNINELNEKLLNANNLSIYLTFKMSKHSLYRDDLSEGEVYPAQSIQVKDLFYDHVQGNVRLSENQRKKLKEYQSKRLEKAADFLVHIWD